MSGKTQSKEESSENNSEKGLDELIETLAQGSRRERQQAAAEIAAIAKEDAQQLAGSIAPLVDALNRPEAQTRWEILDALTEIVVVDARPCEKALPELRPRSLMKIADPYGWRPCVFFAVMAPPPKIVPRKLGRLLTRLFNATMATWSFRICSSPSWNFPAASYPSRSKKR